MDDAHASHPAAAPVGDHVESHLPTYRKVIVILAVLTAVEFAIAQVMPKEGAVFVAGVLVLLALAFVKAVYVARFFMHIKYDPNVLAFLACIPLILGPPLVLVAGFDLIRGPNF